MIEILFWIFLFIIFYAFLGYGIFLYALVKLKAFFVNKPRIINNSGYLPTVTLMIAAFNEQDFIEEKIKNCLELEYEDNKLQIMFVTDGSSDKTPEIIANHPEITLLHKNERAGKMAAIKRAIPYVKSEIIVFTDANTYLNKTAIKELVKHYNNPKVGAVAGEKRINMAEQADASSAGEGFYWKYESKLKKWDYELYSNVAAAGELFSIRTSLYEDVESDTIIDDHMIAMRIAEKGYIIAYEPNAYAVENASENSAEELKRKIRISAGGIQSILRLKKAANPFNNPVLTFQYISHKVLRWAVTPTLMIVAFFMNIYLAKQYPDSSIYNILIYMQIAFYLLAALGWVLEQREVKLKIFFIPYYFVLMNYAALAGTVRYFKGKQSAAWEKSRRK